MNAPAAGYLPFPKLQRDIREGETFSDAIKRQEADVRRLAKEHRGRLPGELIFIDDDVSADRAGAVIPGGRIGSV